MKKYELDAEITRYLRESESFYPQDAHSQRVSRSIVEDIDGARHCYNNLCAAFQAPIPDSVHCTDHQIPGRNGSIPIRIYEQHDYRSPITVIYYHGGGFVLGNLDTHHSICAEMVDATGYKLVAIDYRLAPEHIFPVQFEDALDAFLAIDTGHTLVAGDSAGGTLAAAVCVAQHGSQRQPAGQILIYPALGGQLLNLDSYSRNHDAPGLTTDEMLDYLNLWTGSTPPNHNPAFAPLILEDFSQLPPCIAFAAEYDPLCDDAIAYAEKLQDADVQAEYLVEKGLVHGYLRARHHSAKAMDGFVRICQGIETLGNHCLQQNS